MTSNADGKNIIACPCCASGNIEHRPLGMEGFRACRGCGLIFATPERRERFLAALAGHYGGEDPHDRVAASKGGFFSYALNRLGPPGPGARLLDIGCGYGYFLEMAAARGYAAYGVDIVKEACVRAAARPGVVRVFCGDLASADFKPESFDAVTLWDVLMVQADPAEAAARVKDLLKPGGTIAVRDRNASFQAGLCRAYRAARVPARLMGIQNPSVFHPFTFTAASLRALLKGAGFTNVRVENSPLTQKDPYSVSLLPGLASAAKAAAGAFASAAYEVSSGRWVAGPSLLCWGRKP